MRPKLLIAEDDVSLREGLKDLLDGEGYEVMVAGDGQTALELWREHRPDLLVLDVMLPQLNGFDLCRAIRRVDARTPILFLTAKSEEVDQVVGLKLGGDDYVTKPFSIQTLLARIHALWRRSSAGQDATRQQVQSDPFTFGSAQVHRVRFQVSRDGQTYPLTPLEMKLLELFHAHPGEVIDRNRIVNQVWGMDYYGTTRTLDQHIAQLRKKIEPQPARPRHLITVHGVGYRYEPADAS